MINISRERERLQPERDSFLDKIFSERNKGIEKEREQKHLSLFEEIKAYDASKDVTYNIEKMSLKDKLNFLTTKNLKQAEKLLSGKLDIDRMNGMKLNANDYVLYRMAQTNNGMITEKDLTRYAKENFSTKVERENFVNGTKLRLYSLRSAGCVNDRSRGKYEKVTYKVFDREIEFFARKNISYQVTHMYREKLENFVEDARQYRINPQEQMILDSFRRFGTKDEVIDYLSSFYSTDIEDRKAMLSAQVWKLERFAYLEKVEDTYFTNIDYEFSPSMDYMNRQILYLARVRQLNEDTLKELYDKTNIDKEDIPFIADARVAQLKFKGYIDENNRITDEGKEVLNKILEDMKEKINNKSSLTILELCVKDGFNRDEYKNLLNNLYGKDDVDKLTDKAEYTLKNLKMLQFIDEKERITPEGLMFLEKTKYIEDTKATNFILQQEKNMPDGLLYQENKTSLGNKDAKELLGIERTKIKEIGYFEKQILTEIDKGNMDFKNITIGDADRTKVESICKTYVIDLYSKGYVDLVDGKYVLTDQSKELLYKDNYKITNFDTKNILECSKEGIFCYDYYRQYQRSSGKTDEEIEKGYDMILKRMESHAYNKMVEAKGDLFILTDDFIRACGKNPGTVKKEFSLTDYDKNILNLIHNKVFSKEGVIKELKDLYGNDAERRYYVMCSRAKALVKEGYAEVNQNGFYVLTDRGKSVIGDYNYKLSYFDYKTFLETSIDGVFSKDFYTAYYHQRGFTSDEIMKDEGKINSRLELHVASGLIEKVDDGLYLITDRFVDKYNEDYLKEKEFELGKFDKFILGREEKKVIDIEKYIELTREQGSTGKDLYNKERMFKNRLQLLEREGYVTKLDDVRYMITGKHLVMRHQSTGERITLGRFDRQVYNKIKDMGLSDGFTLDDLKALEDERDIRMFSGRCMKLYNSGYLVEINGKLHFTDRFNDEIGGKKAEVERKEIKINRFDVNKIYHSSKDDVFSKASFERSFMGKQDDFEKEWRKVSDRLTSLQEQGYVMPIGNGEFGLRDKFLEACREHEKKLVRMKQRDQLDLNHEQKFILKELQVFLNISQKQFNQGNDLSSELKNLYDRGLLAYEYRVINGENTKVFYLTSEGKQITSKVTGVKVADIYNSKIHSRPEELQHDVLIYSAYQDAQTRLLANGKVITNIKSDRDMRSEDNHIRMTSSDPSQLKDLRVELSDLEIEYMDVKTGEKGTLNIEVDLGYSEGVIKDKAQNISNLVWYTNSQPQMEKIQRVVPKARVIKL